MKAKAEAINATIAVNIMLPVPGSKYAKALFVKLIKIINDI